MLSISSSSLLLSENDLESMFDPYKIVDTSNRKMILMNLYSYDEESKSGEHSHEGVVRTIKAQYYKNSLANFIRQDGLGATAVIEMEI